MGFLQEFRNWNYFIWINILSCGIFGKVTEKEKGKRALCLLGQNSRRAAGPASEAAQRTGARTRGRTGSLRRLKAYFAFTPSTWQPCAGWIPPGPAALWPNRRSCTVLLLLFFFSETCKNSTGLNNNPNVIIPTPIFF